MTEFRNEQDTHCYNLRGYVLEPGDATLYRFGFMILTESLESRSYFTEPSESETIHGNPVQKVAEKNMLAGRNLISGTGGATYLMIYNFRDPFQVMLVPYRYLDNLSPNYVGELSRRYGLDRYTLAAILLAVKVLVNDPEDVEAALEAMLHAPEYLKDKEKNGN